MAENKFIDKCDGEIGCNVFMTNDTNLSYSSAVKLAISQWYSEESRFNYEKKGEYSESTQHFLQLVCDYSKELGTAIAQSENTLVVFCAYNPSVYTETGRNNDVWWPQGVRY